MSVQELREQGIHVALVSCYPPSTGPLSEYSYHLVKEYQRNSRISKVTIIADRVGDTKEKPSGRIDVVRCWSLNDPVTFFRIVKKSFELRPDIIHFNILFRQFSSNRLFNFLGLTAPAILRLLRRRVVVTIHSLAESLDIVCYSAPIALRLHINTSKASLGRDTEHTTSSQFRMESSSRQRGSSRSRERDSCSSERLDRTRTQN